MENQDRCAKGIFMSCDLPSERTVIGPTGFEIRG